MRTRLAGRAAGGNGPTWISLLNYYTGSTPSGDMGLFRFAAVEALRRLLRGEISGARPAAFGHLIACHQPRRGDHQYDAACADQKLNGYDIGDFHQDDMTDERQEYAEAEQRQRMLSAENDRLQNRPP